MPTGFVWTSHMRIALALTVVMGLTGCHQVNSFVDAVDENPGDNVCARALTRAEISGGAVVTNRCTLRAAIMEANTSALKYTILVPAGTYHLNLPVASGGGALLIERNMRIRGSGAAATIIDQDTGSSVLNVQGGTDVEIDHVTVQGGGSSVAAGGGIFVGTGAAVEMEDLVVRSNEAYTGGAGLAIQPDATVRIHRTTFSGNAATGAFGGAIWNTGELWVYDSTFSGNDSNRAGAIHNQGNMNLRNVTVSGNTAHSPSAGVGGISQANFAVLNNVTITNNQGVGNNPASFRGGGIQTHDGALTVMKNSIVAGNLGGVGPDDCVGELTPDSKYNLIGSSVGCTITSYLSTYLLDVPGNLGALTANGGPTQTHLPLSTSLARNNAYSFPPPAADACEPRDQRGVPRPQGSGPCDMGAVEYTPASTFVTGYMLVDATTDTDIGPLRNGDLLPLNNLPPQLAIRAVVSGSVPASVRFGYDADPAINTEHAAPFALSGDDGGDYYPVVLAPGEHTLTATPFTGANGTGAAGGALTIRFLVFSSE